MLLQLGVAVLVGLVLAQIGTLATTVYLHRALSHRALSVSPGPAWGFRLLVWLTTGIKPRQWVAVHRKHHAFTDTEGDPHSPLLLGWWKVQLTNALLYRRVARDPETVRRYARDLPRDRWDVVFDHGLVGLGVLTAGLIWWLGVVPGLVAYGVHVVAYLALNAAINAIGHTFGRRPHDNSATNLQWLALLTGGEGLHNNHHAAPTSARLALQRGEIDPGWWVIRALIGARWAKVRHSTPLLAKPRPATARAA